MTSCRASQRRYDGTHPFQHRQGRCAFHLFRSFFYKKKSNKITCTNTFLGVNGSLELGQVRRWVSNTKESGLELEKTHLYSLKKGMILDSFPHWRREVSGLHGESPTTNARICVPQNTLIRI